MNKTIVTNPASSESGNPSDEGKNHEKEIENRVRENLRAEYERKTEDLSNKLESYESEKADLESRINELTAAEQKRLETLDSRKVNIEAQVRELETNPEFAGYNEKIIRESSRAKKEATIEAVEESKHEISIVLMKEFIEEKAEKEGIESKKLREELNEVLKVPGTDKGKYIDLLPHERV